MNCGKKMAIKIISVALSVFIFVAVALGVSYERAKWSKNTAAWRAAEQKAAPYEREFWSLQNELFELKSGIPYVSERAEIIVGFLVCELADIAYIREQAARYAFTPVAVIDCAADMASIREWVRAADAEWEFMLHASDFTGDIGGKIAAVKEYMAGEGKADCGVFFLRRADMSSENVSLVMQAGFAGYTSFHDYPSYGQRENGTVYFDYSHVKKSDTSPETRLSMCCDGGASMIYVFDMASVHSGELTESKVALDMQILLAYASQENCKLATVAEVVGELSAIRRIEAENMAEYEAKSVPLEARIAEIRRIIRSIYAEASKG